MAGLCFEQEVLQYDPMLPVTQLCKPLEDGKKTELKLISESFWFCTFH